MLVQALTLASGLRMGQSLLGIWVHFWGKTGSLPSQHWHRIASRCPIKCFLQAQPLFRGHCITLKHAEFNPSIEAVCTLAKEKNSVKSRRFRFGVFFYLFIFVLGDFCLF